METAEDLAVGGGDLCMAPKVPHFATLALTVHLAQVTHVMNVSESTVTNELTTV